MKTIDLPTVIEMVADLQGVDGISQKGDVIVVHVSDESARERLESYLKTKSEEEDADLAHVHIRL